MANHVAEAVEECSEAAVVLSVAGIIPEVAGIMLRVVAINMAAMPMVAEDITTATMDIAIIHQ